MKTETRTIILIVILAYILRVLPYLLGYNIPITDDSLREFWQVLYIIDFGELDLLRDYGPFPVLHLLVYGFTLIGIPPMDAFLFIPQVFTSIGLIFFYLFLKKRFPKKHSLVACFLIAVFGPHVYWSSQPVRETLGLFFLPLIIYLFDSEIRRRTLSGKVLLFMTFVLMTITHHWSGVMTMGFMFFFTLFSIKGTRNIAYALSLTGIFVIFNLIHWHFFFPYLFVLLKSLWEYAALLIILAIVFLAAMVYLRRLDLTAFKKAPIFAISMIAALLPFLIFRNIFPFHYPPQIFILLITFIVLVITGFFLTRSKEMDSIMKIIIFYMSFLPLAAQFMMRGHPISQMPFDPIRILEFIIYPCSIAGAYGLLKITKNRRILFSTSIVILTIMATFIYPPIFIYKTSFEGTPFYDIRSDLRYVPDEAFEIVSWIQSHGYRVITTNNVVNELQLMFYKGENRTTVLITESDLKIKQKYGLVNDRVLGIDNPILLTRKVKNLTPIYSNRWGNIYKPNLTDEELKELIYFKHIDLKIGE